MTLRWLLLSLLVSGCTAPERPLPTGCTPFFSIDIRDDPKALWQEGRAAMEWMEREGPCRVQWQDTFVARLSCPSLHAAPGTDCR